MSQSPIEIKLKAAYGAVLPDGGDAGGSKVSLQSENVVLPKEKVITVNVYVLGINDCHEPDVFVTQVTCSEREYFEESQHLVIAEERARADGYSEPMFSFDEREQNVIGKLGRLFGKRQP
ncbi:MAG: hypothetical protein ACYC2R_15030 [Burkholderiales bacterium]|nr:hypothetical protein [Sulfuricellaceae bacterium]